MLYRNIALGLAGMFASASIAAGAVPALPGPGPPGSFGIQLLADRAASASDPLARIYIIGRLAPGTSISRRIEISNSTRSVAAVAVYPAAAAMTRGHFAFAPGHRANELSHWTSVSRGRLLLKSRGSGHETVTVRVPKGASAGQRFAVVWAQVSQPATVTGSLTLVNRVGVRIYLSVGRGAARPANFAISALHATSKSGRPLVLATVHNSGQRTLTFSGGLTLSAGPGGLRAGPFPLTSAGAMPPGTSEIVEVALDPVLPRGPWHAQLLLRSGLIQRKAEATITFPRSSAISAPKRGSPRSGSSLLIYLAIAVLGLFAVGTSMYLVKQRRSLNAQR